MAKPAAAQQFIHVSPGDVPYKAVHGVKYSAALGQDLKSALSSIVHEERGVRLPCYMASHYCMLGGG